MLQMYQSGEIFYLYNEKMPVDPNSVGPLCREIAKELGFSDWKNCTGHGL
jgi:hypothetical protein